MRESTYEPAADVIERIRRVVGEHVAKWGAEEALLAPTGEVLRRVLTTAFWAGLRENERRALRFSLALIAPSGHGLIFEQPKRLIPKEIARVAPALARTTSLGVQTVDDTEVIWGITGLFSKTCLLVDVVDPGVVVVKLVTDGPLETKNLAIFSFEEASFVGGSGQDLTALLTNMLAEDIQFPFRWWFAQAVRGLAQIMHRHGHGGIILIVPSANEDWRESLDTPIQYALKPEWDVLRQTTEYLFEATKAATAARQERGDQGSELFGARRIQALRANYEAAVELVGTLTAVDGALVIRDDLSVVGYGAKILPPQGELKVTIDRIVDGQAEVDVDLQKLGNTRHQSPARFVDKHRDTTAIVASEDGPISIMTWRQTHLRVVQRAEVLIL